MGSLGRVVRKPVNDTPGLNDTWSIMFSYLKMFFTSNEVGVIWNLYSLKLKGKQYKQNTSVESYKTEIKILANHGLA